MSLHTIIVKISLLLPGGSGPVQPDVVNVLFTCAARRRHVAFVSQPNRNSVNIIKIYTLISKRLQGYYPFGPSRPECQPRRASFL